MRPVPQQAVELVSRWEGLELSAYPDPATGGDPWTIGYGHTGPDVKRGLKITTAHALKLLRDDLGIAAARLATVVRRDVIEELDDCQYGALLSFVFNCGANKTWTIWKVLNARQFDQVPVQLARFVNAGGRKMKGLVNRRNAEIALWNEAEPDEDLPSSVTRSMKTPPTPTNSKPLVQSNSFMATAAGGATSAAVGVTAVADNIRPFAFDSEAVSRLLAVLALVAAILTIGGAVFVWLNKRQANR